MTTIGLGPSIRPVLDRPRITTLCGSMRFYSQMLAVAAEMTADGVIVLAPFVVISASGQTGDRAQVKRRLDVLHRAKIQYADDVVVVSDLTGYVGESTRSEIRWATQLARPIAYRLLSADEAARLVDGVSGGGEA